MYLSYVPHIGHRCLPWLLVLAACLPACHAGGALEAALHGDLKTLQAEIQSAQRSGKLDRDSVEELARAVAGREVLSASGEPAVRRMRMVRACATPLYPVLEDRARRPDDGGAEATLILLENNRIDPKSLVQKYSSSASGSWRAVAARASIRPEHAALRRQSIEDPDERVRRAALHAALVTRAAGDLDALLEAARLDPDPLSKSLATRAVGAIGGKQAVLSLADFWARATEDAKLVIIEAWAMPAAFKDGGEQALVRVAETETGHLALSAAHALFQKSQRFSDLGGQVIARAIADGTRRERQQAIVLATTEHAAMLGAIEKASKDADPYVRVMAHAKLVSLIKHESASLKALRALAKGSGNEAVQARAALAAAGDENVSAALREQLKAPAAEHRKLAARGLLRLGLYPDVATALGDESPDVRTSVACNVLALRN